MALKTALALLGLVALVACGATKDDPLFSATKTAVENIGKKKKTPSMAAQKAALIQKVRASKTDAPILMVELPSRKAVATLSIAGQNNGAITWFDATGRSVTTRDGIVIATRGLGWDVMAADVSGTRRALRGGASSYTQSQRFLDGEDQLNVHQMICSATRAGGTLKETCKTPFGQIENSFVHSGGAVVKARQWLGTGIGYAVVSRIQ